MARVLSDENMALLKVIRESHPDSMDALAKAVGRYVPTGCDGIRSDALEICRL
jgi:predicted transcriptional regulator